MIFMNGLCGRTQAISFIWYFILSVVLGACSIDHGLSPTTQGISGRATFEGAWPDSIAEVRIAVLKYYPPRTAFDIAGYSSPIEPGTNSFDYSMELSPGAYPFVGAICRVGLGWDERALQCILGFYGTAYPETVRVESGKFLEHIDIHVKFGG